MRSLRRTDATGVAAGADDVPPYAASPRRCRVPDVVGNAAYLSGVITNGPSRGGRTRAVRLVRRATAHICESNCRVRRRPRWASYHQGCSRRCVAGATTAHHRSRYRQPWRAERSGERRSRSRLSPSTPPSACSLRSQTRSRSAPSRRLARRSRTRSPISWASRRSEELTAGAMVSDSPPLSVVLGRDGHPGAKGDAVSPLRSLGRSTRDGTSELRRPAGWNPALANSLANSNKVPANKRL